MVPQSWVLVFTAALFGLGLWGSLRATNAVRILMGIELMLNAVNVNLVAFNRYLADRTGQGQVFALFVMTIAAAEAAVGLAIFVSLARSYKGVNVDKINILKW